MITFSVCLSLVILALIAAIFSQQHNAWVLNIDHDLYVPPFFLSEGFYRAFLINLSFAGISTAAGAIQHVRYTAFWMLNDPFLAILVNLGFGLLAALVLVADSTAIQSRRRKVWTTVMVVAGFICFGFAVGVTAKLAGPTSFGPESQQLSFRCSRLPQDDSVLQKWLEAQPGVVSPRVTRDGLIVRVEYERDEALLGPSELDLKGMQYEGASRVAPDFSTKPLTWWLKNMPGVVWGGAVVVALVGSILIYLLLGLRTAPPVQAPPAEARAPEPSS